MRTWTRRTTVAVVATAAITGTSSVASAGATLPELGSGYGCVQTAVGHATVAGGALTTHRPYSAYGTGDDPVCRMPDPTIHSATESWSLEGTLTCFPTGVDTHGPDTFTWDNGRQSVMTWHDRVVGNVDFVTSTIVSGEFTGMHAHWVGSGLTDFKNPFSTATALAKGCALGRAVTTDAGYVGVMKFDR